MTADNKNLDLRFNGANFKDQFHLVFDSIKVSCCIPLNNNISG